jgi:hypothetical protein
MPFNPVGRPMGSLLSCLTGGGATHASGIAAYEIVGPGRIEISQGGVDIPMPQRKSRSARLLNGCERAHSSQTRPSDDWHQRPILTNRRAAVVTLMSQTGVSELSLGECQLIDVA